MAASVTQSAFDVMGATGAQFLAMIIGAFLASTGGFFVAWLLDRMERKRQERSIALVCLDLLSSLKVLTGLAKNAHSRGNPFGPYTLRLVRSCQRDLDIYERNRERIADIADPDVRAEIYQYMARMTLAVDGVLAESEIIAKLEDVNRRPDADPSTAAVTKEEIAERDARRNTSFEFLVETTEELSSPLAEKLRGIAKIQQQNLEALIAANAQSTPPRADS